MSNNNVKHRKHPEMTNLAFHSILLPFAKKNQIKQRVYIKCLARLSNDPCIFSNSSQVANRNNDYTTIGPHE